MLDKYLLRWIFLLVLIVFNLVIGLRTSIGVFYFLFWFLLSVSVLSLLWAAVTYLGSQLELKRIVGDRVEEGDTLHLEMEVKNTSPFSLFYILPNIFQTFCDLIKKMGNNTKFINSI